MSGILMYKVIYSLNAERDLKKLGKKLASRIINKIFFYSQQTDPTKFAKRLTNADLGTFRFRIGDYRVIFDLDERNHLKILMILNIKHRKDIYLN